MTTIRHTALRLIGVSMIAAAMLAAPSAKLQAKELCFEECTFEMMGSCWRWKKACLNLTVSGKDTSAENSTRRADRQQIPSQMDSVLGGGLSTALGGATPSLGPVRGAEIMN